MQFEEHYTREQARELLPQIRDWLKTLVQLRVDLNKSEEGLSALAGPGRDLGGDLVNQWVRILAGIQELLLEFYRREIQVKDLDRGLIDFPAILAGKEVFLCWEQGEADIEFWHDLETGYAGRQRL
jgi:hypothetical protein